MRTGAPGSFVKSRLTTKECLLPIFKSPKERNKWKESMYKRKVGYITCRHIFATDKGSVCVCVCVCVCVGASSESFLCNPIGVVTMSAQIKLRRRGWGQRQSQGSEDTGLWELCSRLSDSAMSQRRSRCRALSSLTTPGEGGHLFFFP